MFTITILPALHHLKMIIRKRLHVKLNLLPSLYSVELGHIQFTYAGDYVPILVNLDKPKTEQLPSPT